MSEYVAAILACFGVGVAIQVVAQIVRHGHH